jgi:NMD protein affecting ribosome stability and mRNA decay
LPDIQEKHIESRLCTDCWIWEKPKKWNANSVAAHVVNAVFANTQADTKTPHFQPHRQESAGK